jgi:hypothetical protein
MRVIQTNEPIVLKGRYLVTDPCYVYGNENWSEFCDLLFAHEAKAAGGHPTDVAKSHLGLGEEYWERRIEAEKKFAEARRSIITLFEIKGKQIPVMSTAYGDGGYPVIDPKTSNYLGSFGVDAGLFAFIPWSEDSHGMRSDLGTIIEIDGVLTCNNGDAFIDGKVVVDTSGDSWDGYEDEDEDDDEDEDSDSN